MLERRFDAELERGRRGSPRRRAPPRTTRARVAARELQLAAERNADQRAYLHELRLVAEEAAAARIADDAARGADDDERDAEARVRARLDAVRGREVRALEARVESLETERARLAEALRAATEAASADDDSSIGDSDTVALDDVAEKSPAAASAIRRERAKSAELAQRVRVLEATLEGERAGREREREEFKARSLGTCLSNSGLESDRPGAPSGSSAKPPPFASPRAVAAPSPVKVPPESTGSLDGGANRFEFSDGIATNPEPSDVASGDTYRRILAEQRGERKVVRLEAELASPHAQRALRGRCAPRRRRRSRTWRSFPERPGGGDAMRRAEDEAHRLGAGTPPRRRRAPQGYRRVASRGIAIDERRRGRGRRRDIVAGAIAAAADAAGVASRHRRRRAATEDRALRGETRAWRAALEDERAASRDAGRAWRKIKLDLETARDEAKGCTPRARHRRRPRSLAEEATELAREEARRRGGRRRSLRARDAATGASAGALREARDEAAKLRLRESHWVGLIGCHRESSRVSRELAELATLHGAAARLAVDAAAGPGAELARRRAAAEAEAESHVEAIKAIADMIEVRDAARGSQTPSSLAEPSTGPRLRRLAQRDARQAPRQVRGSRRVGAQGEASRAEGGGGIGGARASAEARRERRRGARETLRRDV